MDVVLLPRERKGGRTMTFQKYLTQIARGFIFAFALTSTPTFAAVSCSPPSPNGASACFIDPSLDAAALCNDGTLPAFSIRPGSQAGAATWIIWLEGGGECVDQASCAKRAQAPGGMALLSSDGFSAQGGSGILSSSSNVSPILYNANVMIVHYCSSDDWSGNRASVTSFNPTDPTTWHFQGRRIASAAIASLGELDQSFSQAGHILIGGSSAGGLGATILANDLIPVLPRAPDIRLANDAGFTINIGQYDPTAAPPYIYSGEIDAFDTYFTSGINLWHGRGDLPCSASAHTLQAQIDCYNTSLVLQHGYISLPTFVAESQLDLAQLSKEICPQNYGSCAVSRDGATPAGKYVTAFGNMMADELVGSGSNARYSVVAPDTFLHVILTSPTVFTSKYSFPTGKISPREAFDHWLGTRGQAKVVNIGNAPGVAAH